MTENVRTEKKAKLTPKQSEVVSALLKGGTIGNAAKLVHVSERQIYRWMEKPFFKQALTEAGDEAIASAVRALSDAAISAVLVLRTIMHKEKPYREDNVRVRAANSVLTHALHWQELAEIERRLAELERALDAKA